SNAGGCVDIVSVFGTILIRNSAVPKFWHSVTTETTEGYLNCKATYRKLLIEVNTISVEESGMGRWKAGYCESLNGNAKTNKQDSFDPGSRGVVFRPS